jgi:hypothetical protein
LDQVLLPNVSQCEIEAISNSSKMLEEIYSALEKKEPEK